MKHSRELLAEFIGTFVLIFAGTGAVMVDKIGNGAVTHLGISIVFGAVVTALIYSLGHISGAHFNPAVTLAFWSSGFFRRSLVIPYILAQVLGAIDSPAQNLIFIWLIARAFLQSLSCGGSGANYSRIWSGGQIFQPSRIADLWQRTGYSS